MIIISSISPVSYTHLQFNLGMKNTVELLTEKNNLLQAQQEQLQAKYMQWAGTLLDLSLATLRIEDGEQVFFTASEWVLDGTCFSCNSRLVEATIVGE